MLLEKMRERMQMFISGKKLLQMHYEAKLQTVHFVICKRKPQQVEIRLVAKSATLLFSFDRLYFF